MDYQYVLKRSWHILWRYKVLWFFGFLVALTTCSGTYNGVNYDDNVSYQLNEQDWAELSETDVIGPAFTDLQQFFYEPSTADILSTVLGIMLVIAVIVMLWIIVAALLRYVAETAMIKMVNDYEKTGEKIGFRQGFRTGWSRTAWRFFLIDMVVRLPVTLVFLALFLLALAPLLLWFTGETGAGVTGTIISFGLFLTLFLIAIPVNAVLAWFTQFFRRVCALEGQGVLASISQGIQIVRHNLGESVLVGLIVMGITIAFVILMIPLSFLLIPVLLVLLIPGLLFGGTAALLAGGLASLVFDGLLPWVAAGVVGLPILVLFIALPWIFLGGLWEVYISSVWTLTYRQLRERVPVKEKTPADLDVPDLGAMPAKG